MDRCAPLSRPDGASSSRAKISPILPRRKFPMRRGWRAAPTSCKKEKEKPDFTLFSTGSELSLAHRCRANDSKRWAKTCASSRCPAGPSSKSKAKSIKHSIVGGDLGVRVAIEAASRIRLAQVHRHGWRRHLHGGLWPFGARCRSRARIWLHRRCDCRKADVQEVRGGFFSTLCKEKTGAVLPFGSCAKRAGICPAIALCEVTIP